MASTIDRMPRKPKPSDGQKKPNRTPAHVIYARIDQRIGDLFEEHVKSLRPKTDKAAMIEFLIEQYLREQGLLNSQEGDQPPEA